MTGGRSSSGPACASLASRGTRTGRTEPGRRRSASTCRCSPTGTARWRSGSARRGRGAGWRACRAAARSSSARTVRCSDRGGTRTRRCRTSTCRSRPRGRCGLAVALYLGAGVLATAPAVFETDRFLGYGVAREGRVTPGDHLQTTYNLWLPGHQLARGEAPWLDPYSFQPELEPRVNFAGWPFAARVRAARGGLRHRRRLEPVRAPDLRRGGRPRGALAAVARPLAGARARRRARVRARALPRRPVDRAPARADLDAAAARALRRSSGGWPGSPSPRSPRSRSPARSTSRSARSRSRSPTRSRACRLRRRRSRRPRLRSPRASLVWAIDASRRGRAPVRRGRALLGLPRRLRLPRPRRRSSASSTSAGCCRSPRSPASAPCVSETQSPPAAARRGARARRARPLPARPRRQPARLRMALGADAAAGDPGPGALPADRVPLPRRARRDRARGALCFRNTRPARAARAPCSPQRSSSSSPTCGCRSTTRSTPTRKTRSTRRCARRRRAGCSSSPSACPTTTAGSVYLYYAMQAQRERPLGYSTSAPPEAFRAARSLPERARELGVTAMMRYVDGRPAEVVTP